MKLLLNLLFGSTTSVKHCMLLLVVLSLNLSTPALAKHLRCEWNQAEAVKMVKAVKAQEEAGDFCWDKINWITDGLKAIARSQNEQKPILVYFFVKGRVGPATAQC